MRVLVFGGRHYDKHLVAYEALTYVHRRCGISMIIQGGASGADTLAYAWATAVEVPCETEFAAWDDLDVPGAVIKKNKFGKRYNALAGFQRNQRMIDRHQPELAIAFPGGNGTADMRRRCDEAGLALLQIYLHDFSAHTFQQEMDEIDAWIESL